MESEPAKEARLDDLQEAAQQLEELRSIIESAELAVVTINERHEVVYMNPAAENMFGYQRSEIIGGDLSPLIPPEHRESHRNYVERYVRTRRGKLIGHSAQLEAERRDGARFPVQISFSVAEVGGRLFFTAMIRDLTKEQGLADEVKKSQRLAILGEMVATVGHEIRSPLALIGGFARQLQREPDLGEKARQKLGIIVHEVQRLENILNELKDLSRPQRYNWSETQMSGVVEHVAELMAPELSEEGVEFSLSLDGQVPVVMADGDRLSQVLINLINNAAQASRETEQPRVELRLRADGQRNAILEVVDNGEGLLPQTAEKVFTPFYTTKEGGTGLGLPVARRIVEEHGGTIELLPNDGPGATARIVLPAAPQLQQRLPLN